MHYLVSQPQKMEGYWGTHTNSSSYVSWSFFLMAMREISSWLYHGQVHSLDYTVLLSF